MPPTIVEPKPGVDMGRVIVKVSVENEADAREAADGGRADEAVRRIEVEALVDTGATFLCLPESMVEQLGLRFHRMRDTRTVVGVMSMKIYSGAAIEVEGRACNVEVMALPEGRQALIGGIPLLTLDLWVDTANHKLVGNPEHGGQWMAGVF